MATQLITPNPDIPCTPGWCLQYVRQTFGLPAHYATATEAWDNSTSQHADWNFPDGVDHPVWFSLEAIPAGHVALRMADGTVYSSSDNVSTPHHHSSVADLMAYYAYYNLPLTHLGWTEDVAGYPVISLISVDSIPSTPAPEQDWFDMADKETLKQALREVLSEHDVLDEIALALLHRDCFIIDPSGQTGEVAQGQTTNLAKKINWMAHNDAQILNAIVAVSKKLDVEHPVLLPESTAIATVPPATTTN